MINKSGLSGMVKNLSSNPQSNNPKTGNSLSSTTLISARVTDIILDENHPLFSKFGGWNGIGTILYEVENFGGGETTFAKPLFPQQSSFPLINELVVLIELPNNDIGNNLGSKNFYYINSISLWNHPHHNAYPNSFDPSIDAQSQDYQQVEGGSVRRVSDNSTDIELNSPSNPSQNTFIERTSIHPLLSFPGDVLYEGRWGNSLRFGSTAKSSSGYSNNWSSTGNNGNPIVVLRNGQSEDISDEGWIPITENINTDLSSIYLTSTQKLPIDRKWVDRFNIFTPTSKPITLSSYSQPQILMNSSRIVLNANTDSILISGEKSFNVSVGGYSNINSKNLYIDSQNVRLGNSNATESLLLGDTTIALFDQLLQTLLNLTSVLESDMIYPGGVAAPNAPLNIVASNTKQIITQIQSQLDSTKSKISKTI
tara:strand:+ start:682 stop:1956 length:1275 start_codon:yes stop_codon:yes gene_type:complete